MYSRHSFGFLASSVLRRIVRAFGLQPPHLVFICWTKTRLTLTLRSDSHFAIPLSHACFSFCLVHSCTRGQDHAGVLQLHRRDPVALSYAKEIAFAPNVVALPLEIFAGWFSLLLAELLLLRLDPVKFGNDENSDRVETHARGCGNPHAATRRGTTHMDVLNGLQNNVHCDATEVKHRRPSHSV